MKKLILDVEVLLKNNWKVVLVLAIVFYLSYYYTDIKKGIIDGCLDREITKMNR